MMEEDRQDPLIAEALRWLVLLQDPGATAAERAAFDRWLATGPDRAAAWERASRVWSRATQLEAEFRAVPPDGTVLPFIPRTERRPPVLTRRRWLGGAAAAGLALFAGGYALRPDLFADHRTAVGERRTVDLADGSQVELGSASALSIAFGPDRRRLALQAGEAFFTVAPDPDRPFVVAAGSGEARAVGSAFNVKLASDRVTVSVVRDAVAVAAGSAAAVRLAEGRQVSYGPDGIEPARDADIAAVLAWRRDRLVYHDAPLSEVIADLERYRTGRVLVTDSRIAALPVTAVFDVRETDAALRTIATALPVRVRRLADLLVVISPAG